MAHMQGWESDDDLHHPLDRQWEQPDGSVQIAFHIRGVNDPLDTQLEQPDEVFVNDQAMKQ